MVRKKATITAAQKRMIDRLGALKAELATLAEEEEQIRDTLIKQKVTSGEGAQFRVTISRVVRRTMNTQRMFEDYGIDEDVLEYYREDGSPFYTAKVKARIQK